VKLKDSRREKKSEGVGKGSNDRHV